MERKMDLIVCVGHFCMSVIWGWQKRSTWNVLLYVIKKKNSYKESLVRDVKDCCNFLPLKFKWNTSSGKVSKSQHKRRCLNVFCNVITSGLYTAARFWRLTMC